MNKTQHDDRIAFSLIMIHRHCLQLWFHISLYSILFFSSLASVSVKKSRSDGVIFDDNAEETNCKKESYHLDIAYETHKLPNEFIVHFRHYYWPVTREKYIKAALKRLSDQPFCWKIIARDNPANLYPSDFDVVRFQNKSPRLFVELAKHPAIKQITPHQNVLRHLNYVALNSSDQADQPEKYAFMGGRHLLRVLPRQITYTLQANVLWKLGITGKGIKVAVFDTGLAKDHPHFRRVKERTNWTNEKWLDDGVSHGTFVAGIIASAKECLGFAPDAELHIYRVFTNAQVSYTSWFLDAFNYAIFRKINILNLSIGGPDFLDHPFVDKVLELSANKVIMVSAIGNDGPLYGTLNNPGDQSDVIGVGGINFDEKVSKFSSRGMTTWELPYGYGRLKPDIVTFGSQVKGSNIRSGCRSLSGTSVASPVVAGAITLITSGALERLKFVNPSSMKQILIEGATPLQDNNMFEQGHGKLNILRSMKLLAAYIPKVTLSPSYLDFTENYMWPYSSQALFCGSTPIIVNVTILNGISVTGSIAEPPTWHPFVDKHGEVLNVAITYSSMLWPWSGWMAIHIGIKSIGCEFEGVARGFVKLLVENPSPMNDSDTISSTVYFPINVKVISRPPRHKRILWDQYHNLRYPPGYIPRDNLKMKSDPLDWRSDHIHTNFRDMYNHLRSSGYYVDVLRMPYTCFNAADYGTLLIVDPEEEYFDEEITKLQEDVYERKLNLIVFADWYNTTVMKKIKFFDENTRQWWIPDTGGANVPALNDLLKSFGIGFSDFVAEGHFRLGDHAMYFASGTTISQFPHNTGSVVIGATLTDQGAEIMGNTNSGDKSKHFVPILGLFQMSHTIRRKFSSEKPIITPSIYEENTIDQLVDGHVESQEHNPLLNKRILLSIDYELLEKANNFDDGDAKLGPNHDRDSGKPEGRIAVFGDSNCLDSTHLEKACFWLLDALLEYTMNAHKTGILKNLNKANEFKTKSADHSIPLRLTISNLHRYSKVLDTENKYKKQTLQTCEQLPWRIGYPANYTDIRFLNEAARVKDDNIYNIPSNNELLKRLESVNVLPNYQKYYQDSINENSYVDPPYPFEDSSIFTSLAFIIILSFVVLMLFLRWFKRRKSLSSLVL